MPEQVLYNPYMKNSLEPTRIKYAGVPSPGNWDQADQSAQAGADAGGIADPSALKPDLPPNVFAKTVTPDMARMKALQDQSAIMQGFANARARATPGNLNPESTGDNVLTSFIKARNAGEMDRMKQQTTADNQNSDLYNKLLENRQTQVKNYADIGASRDLDVHSEDMGAKLAGLQAQLANKSKIAHDAVQGMLGGKEISAKALVEAARLRGGIGNAEKVGSIDGTLKNAYLLRNALNDLEHEVSSNPTPIQDSVTKSGIPGAGIVGKAIGEINPTQFEQSDAMTRVKQLYDTTVAANTSNAHIRPSIAQVGLAEHFDTPLAGDDSDVKFNKIHGTSQKVDNLIEKLESELRMVGQAGISTPSHTAAPVKAKFKYNHDTGQIEAQ